MVRLFSLRIDLHQFLAVCCLPDQEIELGRNRSIGGATKEEVNEFLLQHVSVDRIDEDVLGECPNCTEDVQREFTSMDNEDRAAQSGICLGSVAFVVCLIHAAIEGGLNEFLVIGALIVLFGLLFLVPAWCFGKRNRRQKRAQLQAWLDQIRARNHSPT